ncbi:MAG: type II toxin-antitoxin system PemK/MazF family toxin [Caldilineaceae bacterium SB0665_bin_25]|nr:type II toxin-antitoxin system PemK/MazF family toxin [Caldilineaceae bacterium SB0665_bin_25]
MKYRRGDVFLALFPYSDLRSAKRRPVVVVQSNELETDLAQLIVAMITSDLRRAGHPSRVTATRNSAQGKRSGLLTDSVVMTDNLYTARERAFNRRIGFLEMDAIDSALRHTLGLK